MENPVRLGPDLEALVRGLPAPLLRCEPVSRHGAARESRETFRLDLADGSTWKGRRLPSAASAARVEAFAARLDPRRFTRVLAREGSALLEEWLSGEPLDQLPADPAHLDWAAETLGGLHSLPAPRGRSGSWLRARRELLSRHLLRLADAGAIPRADAMRLREVALARAPREVEVRLVHRDLCPENIVVDAGGRLRSVDNVTVRAGAPEEDLARTCYRWPLDGPARDRFLRAYGARRDPAAFLRHRRFWMIAALSHATWIRHSRGYARADVPLRRLLAERNDVPCCASTTADS
ncbi:MAG TPA: aminoglycoside phosphotransferase family protein [Planctomycetota bacterium]|nr:aminoglycoside phosphotransferase family protein [Planctomycetota bacterium]